MVAAHILALALGSVSPGDQVALPPIDAPAAAPAPTPVATPAPSPVATPAPETTPAPVLQTAPTSPAVLVLPVFAGPASTTIVGYTGPKPLVAAQDARAADTGDAIVVTGRSKPPPGDPLQALNAKSYEVSQAADRAIVAPAAHVYKGIVPRQVRTGIRHFFRNLQEPIVALNYLLQLHPGKAAETVARFALNSTIGLGGVIDVARARPFNLPRRSNDFANTLGYYGVGPGAFFFLPLVGPTTVRDLIGGAVDSAYVGVLARATIGSVLTNPKVALPTGIVRGLDFRIEFDERIKTINDKSDPYVAAREYYLNRRAAEIEALHHPSSQADAETDLKNPPVDGVAHRKAAPKR